ncbi:MAG: NAD(P)H-dependent oxidoreductase subunit E [Bacteroidales bacterium]|nr:NAD(P)H-dependent oxidoreductase subunit E [Bacteroidales bacterium]
MTLSKTYNITICMGSSCFSRGNKEILEKIREFITRHHLTDRVILRGSHCLGNCSKGPSMIVDDRLISPLSIVTIDSILEKELKTG